MEDFPKEYQRLIKQVRQIDREAAEYLENEAPKRADFIRYSYDLSECFSFRNAPQGHPYWWQIFDKLEQKRAEYDDLVCRIASLGVEQSVIDYLRDEAMDLESFTSCRYISSMFKWKDIPQGYEFWESLNKQLYGGIPDLEIEDGTLEPEPQEPVYPDLEAVQKRFFNLLEFKRFFKLLEFKRKHCPEVVFGPFQDNYTVAYMHEEECWTPVFAHTVENPTAIFLSEEAAYLLADQLNSGEFEL